MPKKTKKEVNSNALLSAVQHIALCQDATNACTFHNGYICASNGILSAGVSVAEEFQIRPMTHKLLQALESCKEGLVITQLEHRLSVRSGTFRALIPCLTDPVPDLHYPDSIAGSIVDGKLLLNALQAAGMLADPRASRLVNQSILLCSGAIFGTSGTSLIEAWNKESFKQNFILPKEYVLALNKLNKIPSQYGYSENSFTFYFEDKSWLKTALLAGQWPDAPIRLLEKATMLADTILQVPNKFFESIELVASFIDNDTIELHNNCVCSKNGEYQVGIEIKKPDEKVLLVDARLMKQIAGYAKWIDWSSEKAMFWYGDFTRGAVAYKYA